MSKTHVIKPGVFTAFGCPGTWCGLKFARAGRLLDCDSAEVLDLDKPGEPYRFICRGCITARNSGIAKMSGSVRV